MFNTSCLGSGRQFGDVRLRRSSGIVDGCPRTTAGHAVGRDITWNRVLPSSFRFVLRIVMTTVRSVY